MIFYYLMLACIVGYLIGNINFARIYSKAFSKKDITTIGSKNPGTMNMLRTNGFGEAMLTLVCEAIKCGLPALCAYFLFEHFFAGAGNVAYFLTALGAVVGHCFPVFYKFKGGKGVACTFGMFLFHPQLWWVGIIVFVCCFLLFFFIKYPFLISFSFIFTMTIYSTVIFWQQQVPYIIVVIYLMWLNVALLIFMHRSNISRLVRGKENKVNFFEKVFKRKKKDSVEKTQDVEQKEDGAGETFAKGKENRDEKNEVN